MSNLVPDYFPANQYQWVLSSCIRIDGSILRVYFKTHEDYKKTLDNPFELAKYAIDNNCNEMFLYVLEDEKPKKKLLTANIMSLGRRLGFIGHPGGQTFNRKSV